MVFKKEVLDAINRQINKELYSAYLYLSMSAFIEIKSFHGMAHWLKEQSKEEVKHAMRLYKHIIDREGNVELYQIAEPPKSWKSHIDVFEKAYEHEVEITLSIHKLVEIAEMHKDRAAYAMLQWFVNEQIEEEASTKKIADQLKMIGQNCGSILHYDKSLGKREEDKSE